MYSGRSVVGETQLLTQIFQSSPSLRLSYVSYTATNYLFISSAGVHRTKFSPIFASFQQKCLEKFFRLPGGAPAPRAPPGYAYAQRQNSSSSSHQPLQSAAKAVLNVTQTKQAKHMTVLNCRHCKTVSSSSVRQQLLVPLQLVPQKNNLLEVVAKFTSYSALKSLFHN